MSIMLEAMCSKDKFKYLMITIFKIKVRLMFEYLPQKVIDIMCNFHRFHIRNNSNFKINCCKTMKKYKILFYKGLIIFIALPFPFSSNPYLINFHGLHVNQIYSYYLNT